MEFSAGTGVAQVIRPRVDPVYSRGDPWYCHRRSTKSPGQGVPASAGTLRAYPLAMSRHSKRRRWWARGNLVFWSVVTLPGSWFIPLLGEIWFQRAALLLTFLGLVLPATDIDQTTQVREETAST